MIIIGYPSIRCDEIFKQIFINNEPTNFYVSDLGNVINVKTGHIMKQKCTKHTDYYCIVCLHHKQKDYHKSVHRLVAEAFIPNPDNKPQINHKDCDKTNNTVTNLEWCTAYENMQHAKSHGLRPRGEKNGTSKYTTKQIIKVCKLLESNKLSYKEIMIETNVNIDTIRDIRSHKSWRHVSKKYNVDNYNRDGREEKVYSNELKRDIMKLISEGLTNKEIRDVLCLEKNNKIRALLTNMRKLNKIIEEGSTTSRL